MKKWILIVAILSAAGVVGWQVGKNTQASSGSELLHYIPADTIYYFGGESNKELANFLSKFPLMGGYTPSQSQQMEEAFELFAGQDAASIKFFTHLIKQYVDTTDGTFGAFADFTGLARTGPFVLYSHGMAPVFRMKLANSDTLNQMLEQASTESGWQYEEVIIDQHKVRVWPLNEADKKATLQQLAITIVDNVVTATLLAASDDEATKKERLAMTKPEQSIAQSGEIEAIKKRYKYTDDFILFFNLQRIARGILWPEKNSFGQQIQQYFSSDITEVLKENTTEVCRQEYDQFISAIPRITAGYRSTQVNGESLDLSYHGILEIDHEFTTTHLQKMRGHIPQHTLKSDDKLFGLGIGFDVSNAPPALTALWNAFITTEFKCNTLVYAQNQVKQGNPALLAMATGLVQGIQGVGASLYSVKWEEGSDYPSDASALLSIAAKDPQTIVALTSMVPFLSSVSIPTDGTATDIVLPMMPPTIEIKAAIKGQHIVVYAGQQAQKVAESLANETLEPNGIYGLSANYRKFAEVLDNPISSFGQAGCIAQQEFIQLMDSSPMDFNFIMDAEKNGLSMFGDMTMSRPKLHDLNLVGEYSLQRLNESCKWEKAGNESVQQDGSGGYVEKDDAGKCELYKTGYKWRKTHNQIIMDTHMEKTRESCDDEWEDAQSQVYTCYLLNVSDKQFDCIYDAGTEDATLYRYTRK
ncbi:hypothetical protein [Agarilytica rhodophyticola]|uniref:hypothetical protein n=1 Tax=Agarilytica rhodophyticola TaxID=1737490 RepID=UPI000B3463CE|nr:hypothetical protein [Agarilytica rhodophyticola]